MLGIARCTTIRFMLFDRLILRKTITHLSHLWFCVGEDWCSWSPAGQNRVFLGGNIIQWNKKVAFITWGNSVYTQWKIVSKDVDAVETEYWRYLLPFPVPKFAVDSRVHWAKYHKHCFDIFFFLCPHF